MFPGWAWDYYVASGDRTTLAQTYAASTAINTRLRRPDDVYVDGLLDGGAQSTHASQIADAYAVAYGLAPDPAAVTGHLVGLGLQMGPMTADVLLSALHRAGRDDQVLTRLTDPARGWAGILAQAGTVGVHWRTTGGGAAVTVSLPVNVTAEVHVPVPPGRKPRVAGAARFDGFRDGHAVYTVGSGTTAFR